MFLQRKAQMDVSQLKVLFSDKMVQMLFNKEACTCESPV
jgi:hypothetical protein